MFWLLRLILVGVLIMARGAPDDSNVKVGKDVFRLDDLAELAVRLGSPVTYNRAGNVLMIDGFEEGLTGWSKNRTGVAAEVELSQDRTYAGGISVRIHTGTGLTPYGGISKFLPPVSSCKMGMQMCFSLNFRVARITWEYGYYKPSLKYNFGLEYDHVAGTLAYKSAPGIYTPFATPGKLYFDGANWHNVKLIVDTKTGSYVRCILDNEVYDMSELICDIGGWISPPLSAVGIMVYGDGAFSGTLFVDNVIVTYNEF